MISKRRRRGGDEMVVVRFALEIDDDWPPVGSEGLWAEPLGDRYYRIDNTPWFAPALAADDIVVAHEDSDGVLWIVDRILCSGRLTIRVFPFRAGPLGGSLQAVIDAFAPLGVSGEGALPNFPILALDVPPDVDWAPVKKLLHEGQAAGWWDYEESCVSDAWIDL